MVDHALFQKSTRIDFVIAEVKARQPCSLNGPWTNRARQNVHYLLEAVGPLPQVEVRVAAEALYRAGSYTNDRVRARFFAFGGSRSVELANAHAAVPQLTWSEVLRFMHSRYRAYRRQKKDNEQWDGTGRWLYRTAIEMPIDAFEAAARP
jgi:hypothetical protein